MQIRKLKGGHGVRDNKILPNTITHRKGYPTTTTTNLAHIIMLKYQVGYDQHLAQISDGLCHLKKQIKDALFVSHG